jgi:hypothetical protein
MGVSKLKPNSKALYWFLEARKDQDEWTRDELIAKSGIPRSSIYGAAREIGMQMERQAAIFRRREK